ncbi:hypothetical protein SCE1572_40300 [Sorangium cellulosum So0157-2]|uniref:Uncharacterized protein n=1 Tax=Sorangium cellulosum So0157-2 TaxID=1254432 RepID=S4Y7J1_SORCE|nr:hypothetical protein SCE1572_40300 [Sorangium cellulosum So0157-2]
MPAAGRLSVGCPRQGTHQRHQALAREPRVASATPVDINASVIGNRRLTRDAAPANGPAIQNSR